jgi:hypothetical protein
MKKGVALLAAGWLLLLAQAGAQAAPPELSFEQAAKIAVNYLRSSGLAKDHSVTGLVLEPSSILNAKFHWIATWTPAVDLGNRKETGLQISMDGSYSRVVNKAAK